MKNWMELKPQTSSLKMCQMHLATLRAEMKKIEDVLNLIAPEFDRLMAASKLPRAPVAPRPYVDGQYKHPDEVLGKRPPYGDKGKRVSDYQRMFNPPDHDPDATTGKKSIIPEFVKDFFNRPG